MTGSSSWKRELPDSKVSGGRGGLNPMEENKVRVQLKPGVESGRIHTTGFDLVLAPGETAEVTEEQYQRHVLATGLFEAVANPLLISPLDAAQGGET